MIFTVNGHTYTYEDGEIHKRMWVITEDKDGWDRSFHTKNISIPDMKASPEFYIKHCVTYQCDEDLRIAIRYYASSAAKQFSKMKDKAEKKRIAKDILNYVAWRDCFFADQYQIEDITDAMISEAEDWIGSFEDSDYDHYHIQAKIIGDILGIPVDLNIDEEMARFRTNKAFVAMIESRMP